MSADIVTFGELMLRLTSPGGLRLSQAPHLEVAFGGAEANVAVMLAQLGARVDFVTCLPENELAERAIRELRGLGVGVGQIKRGGGRLGLYFLEPGASVRSSRVLYDRSGSAFAEANPEQFDWSAICAGAKWLHWSGITPALSEKAAGSTAAACQEAKRQGLLVSFDLNYRAQLWSHERAGKVLTPLLEQVDLCVTSSEEAHAVLGIGLDTDTMSREEAVARRLQERFGCRYVVLTMRRGDQAGATSWAAMLWTEGRACFSRRYDLAIEDRVGAGDSFTGALLFALLRGDSPEATLEFAVAASALKHTVHGDYNLVTLAEVEALLAGQSGGRVRR